MAEVPICFEEFELDLESYELRRSGRPVKLERIPMELLILLLENTGKLVRRDVIQQRLWGENVFVETEHSVNTAVNKLRATLRDDPREPRFVQTVVGQGYRFIAKTTVIHPSEGVPAPTLIPFPAAGSCAEESQSLVPGNGHGRAPSHNGHRTSGETLGAPLQLSSVPLPASPQITVDVSRKRRWVILAGLAAVGILLVAAAAVYLLRGWQRPEQASSAEEGFRSIAVLPFVNLAQNSNQDYLVDGMTDQLITDLAGDTSLRVISPTSVMQYKGVHAPLPEIARMLNVGAVLEGSFFHNGKQMRITAQLLDAKTDRHLWAQVYEESGDDLLTMQEQVTKDIVREVALALGTSLKSSQLQPINESAREAYLRGSYLWNRRTLNSLNKSIRYYNQAIQADPNYADAYAALGRAYVLLSSYGGPGPSDPLVKAQAAAEHALRLDSGLAEAHTVLGAVKTEQDWDWHGAELEYRHALQLNPSDPTAHHWYSLHLSRMGRRPEAEAEIESAIALDPLSPIINTDAAETAYWAGNPSLAEERVQEVLALNPDFAEAHLVLGKVREQQGRYEQALAEFKIAYGLFGGGANVEALRGHALALAGAKEQALEIAKELEAESTREYVSGVDIAEVYCGLHRTNDAMRWLDQAYQRRDKGINMLGVDPIFDGCRGDARFQDLLRRLRLIS